MKTLTGLALALTLAVAPLSAEGRFRPLDPAAKLAFPRDHGSHDDARLEWWYLTGHLLSEDGDRFGYQLTFFRVGLLDEPRPNDPSSFRARDLHLAHFALTNLAEGTFEHAERLHRTGPAASAREERLAVTNEDWRLEELGGKLVLFARTGQGAKLRELSLLLTPEKPFVLHGENGLSRKGTEPDAVSRYVSFTRLAAAGALVTGSEPRRVSGTSWMDHEWGSGSIGKDAAGWDWFAVQLDDGRDLMLYRMRSTDGAASPYTSGTLVSRDGKAESLSPKDIVIEETARWTSPRSKAEYPARWTLRVARAGLALDVVPAISDQELVTAGSTRVTYWEGACTVRDLSGKALGRAYVELTGYAGVGGLGFFR